MDTVKALNAELCSLYDVKPPISKAKMTQITKTAMKAVKFYKHVVHSVEKFIQKCRPEYKVPGLYVIDSIIRQSRHQHGPDKDVYGPRFATNIVVVFQSLFTCPSDDIPRIVRVLNLWLKNGVYTPTIIQPLLDMAADPHNHKLFESAMKQVESVTGLTPTLPLMKTEQKLPALTADALQLSTGLDSQADLLKVITQLLQPATPSPTPQQLQMQQLLVLQQQLLQQSTTAAAPSGDSKQTTTPAVDNGLLMQIQTLTEQLLASTSTTTIAAGVAAAAASGGGKLSTNKTSEAPAVPVSSVGKSSDTQQLSEGFDLLGKSETRKKKPARHKDSPERQTNLEPPEQEKHGSIEPSSTELQSAGEISMSLVDDQLCHTDSLELSAVEKFDVEASDRLIMNDSALVIDEDLTEGREEGELVEDEEVNESNTQDEHLPARNTGAMFKDALGQDSILQKVEFSEQIKQDMIETNKCRAYSPFEQEKNSPLNDRNRLYSPFELDRKEKEMRWKERDVRKRSMSPSAVEADVRKTTRVEVEKAELYSPFDDRKNVALEFGMGWKSEKIVQPKAEYGASRELEKIVPPNAEYGTSQQLEKILPPKVEYGTGQQLEKIVPPKADKSAPYSPFDIDEDEVADTRKAEIDQRFSPLNILHKSRSDITNRALPGDISEKMHKRTPPASSRSYSSFEFDENMEAREAMPTSEASSYFAPEADLRISPLKCVRKRRHYRNRSSAGIEEGEICEHVRHRKSRKHRSFTPVDDGQPGHQSPQLRTADKNRSYSPQEFPPEIPVQSMPSKKKRRKSSHLATAEEQMSPARIERRKGYSPLYPDPSASPSKPDSRRSYSPLDENRTSQWNSAGRYDKSRPYSPLDFDAEALAPVTSHQMEPQTRKKPETTAVTDLHSQAVEMDVDNTERRSPRRDSTKRHRKDSEKNRSSKHRSREKSRKNDEESKLPAADDSEDVIIVGDSSSDECHRSPVYHDLCDSSSDSRSSSTERGKTLKSSQQLSEGRGPHIPPRKRKHATVCSRTLWIGHLGKQTTEDELLLELHKHGNPSVKFIPPRGCAYACFSTRREAWKALDKLKTVRLHANLLKVSWAPGIGVKKSSFKDLFDVNVGVAYVPWSKLPSDIDALLEGSIVDEESLQTKYIARDVPAPMPVLPPQPVPVAVASSIRLIDIPLPPGGLSQRTAPQPSSGPPPLPPLPVDDPPSSAQNEPTCQPALPPDDSLLADIQLPEAPFSGSFTPSTSSTPQTRSAVASVPSSQPAASCSLEMIPSSSASVSSLSSEHETLDKMAVFEMISDPTAKTVLTIRSRPVVKRDLSNMFKKWSTKMKKQHPDSSGAGNEGGADVGNSGNSGDSSSSDTGGDMLGSRDLSETEKDGSFGVEKVMKEDAEFGEEMDDFDKYVRHSAASAKPAELGYKMFGSEQNSSQHLETTKSDGILPTPVNTLPFSHSQLTIVSAMSAGMPMSLHSAEPALSDNQMSAFDPASGFSAIPLYQPHIGLPGIGMGANTFTVPSVSASVPSMVPGSLTFGGPQLIHEIAPGMGLMFSTSAAQQAQLTQDALFPPRFGGPESFPSSQPNGQQMIFRSLQSQEFAPFQQLSAGIRDMGPTSCSLLGPGPGAIFTTNQWSQGTGSISTAGNQFGPGMHGIEGNTGQFSQGMAPGHLLVMTSLSQPRQDFPAGMQQHDPLHHQQQMPQLPPDFHLMLTRPPPALLPEQSLHGPHQQGQTLSVQQQMPPSLLLGPSVVRLERPQFPPQHEQQQHQQPMMQQGGNMQPNVVPFQRPEFMQHPSMIQQQGVQMPPPQVQPHMQPQIQPQNQSQMLLNRPPQTGPQLLPQPQFLLQKPPALLPDPVPRPLNVNQPDSQMLNRPPNAFADTQQMMNRPPHNAVQQQAGQYGQQSLFSEAVQQQQRPLGHEQDGMSQRLPPPPSMSEQHRLPPSYPSRQMLGPMSETSPAKVQPLLQELQPGLLPLPSLQPQEHHHQQHRASEFSKDQSRFSGRLGQPPSLLDLQIVPPGMQNTPSGLQEMKSTTSGIQIPQGLLHLPPPGIFTSVNSSCGTSGTGNMQAGLVSNSAGGVSLFAPKPLMAPGQMLEALREPPSVFPRPSSTIASQLAVGIPGVLQRIAMESSGVGPMDHIGQNVELGIVQPGGARLPAPLGTFGHQVPVRTGLLDKPLFPGGSDTVPCSASEVQSLLPPTSQNFPGSFGPRLTTPSLMKMAWNSGRSSPQPQFESLPARGQQSVALPAAAIFNLESSPMLQRLQRDLLPASVQVHSSPVDIPPLMGRPEFADLLASAAQLSSQSFDNRQRSAPNQSQPSRRGDRAGGCTIGELKAAIREREEHERRNSPRHSSTEHQRMEYHRSDQHDLNRSRMRRRSNERRDTEHSHGRPRSAERRDVDSNRADRWNAERSHGRPRSAERRGAESSGARPRNSERQNVKHSRASPGSAECRNAESRSAERSSSERSHAAATTESAERSSSERSRAAATTESAERSSSEQSRARHRSAEHSSSERSRAAATTESSERSSTERSRAAAMTESSERSSSERSHAAATTESAELSSSEQSRATARTESAERPSSEHPSTERLNEENRGMESRSSESRDEEHTSAECTEHDNTKIAESHTAELRTAEHTRVGSGNAEQSHTELCNAEPQSSKEQTAECDNAEAQHADGRSAECSSAEALIAENRISSDASSSKVSVVESQDCDQAHESECDQRRPINDDAELDGPCDSSMCGKDSPTTDVENQLNS